MTNEAEAQARAAMQASQAMNQPQAAMTEESRALLVSILRLEMRDAVSEGISAAMTDENARRFFSAGLEVLREEAAAHTGRFILDGLWAGAKKLFWIVVFVTAVYSVGGWDLLKTMGAAIYQGRGAS